MATITPDIAPDVDIVVADDAKPSALFRVRRFLASVPLGSALVLLVFSSRGSLPLGKMGERLQVHPTSVTSIVRRLEASGFVVRRPHPEDGRAVLAEITDRGRQVVDEATRALVTTDFGLGALTEAQLGQLSDLLRPLRRDARDF